ncbi:MAG: DsbE family thiol:disulfide interchange protein [Pseudomonadota bacterium]
MSDETVETGSRSRFQFVLAALPVLVFGALAVLFYFRLFSGDPSTIPSALIGKQVPEFTLPAIEDLAEGATSIPGLGTRDLVGAGDVTVVNVWASWCVPCRDENPMLLELEARGYSVVGINYKDSPANARRFLGEFGNPFERVGADRNGRVSIDWGVYGVPETFIVDKTGAIVHKHIGPFDRADLVETLIPAIEDARATP